MSAGATPCCCSAPSSLVSSVTVTVIFLHPAPVAPSATAWRQQATDSARDSTLGLPPNLLMILLMIAVYCCCVPMAMPMQHVVAFCGDLGFASQYGAAMLSVLLGTAFLARQFWGWLSDRIGGFQTLLFSSLVQATALAGFLLTKDMAALFAVSAVFGLGLSGLLPAYVIVIRDCFSIQEANWRIPTVMFAGLLGMASGGWGAGPALRSLRRLPAGLLDRHGLQPGEPCRAAVPAVAASHQVDAAAADLDLSRAAARLPRFLAAASTRSRSTTLTSIGRHARARARRRSA